MRTKGALSLLACVVTLTIELVATFAHRLNLARRVRGSPAADHRVAALGVWADPSANGRAARWHGTRWADAVGGKDRLYFLYSACICAGRLRRARLRWAPRCLDKCLRMG